MKGKVIWRNIHLWLGLLAGLIFFLECFSGTCLVFEDEITSWIDKDHLYVKVRGTQKSLDELKVVAQQADTLLPVSSVKVYRDEYRSSEFILGKPARKGGGEKKLFNTPVAKTVYVNPYTAEVLAVKTETQKPFFKWMLNLHRTLLLNDFGKTILGISTFIVLTILITGIVLWWPKTRKILRQRLKLKLDANWKRINHDLHIVLGFYTAFFFVIILVTSLPWSYQWANKALYTMTGSKPMEQNKEADGEQAASKGKKKGMGKKENFNVPLQQVFVTATDSFPSSLTYTIVLPAGKKPFYQVTAISPVPLHDNAFDNMNIDATTGNIVEVKWYWDTPTGWKIRRYMKPMHMGSIGGVPTKILAFLVVFIGTSFPITGVIMWLNRIKLKKKRLQ